MIKDDYTTLKINYSQPSQQEYQSQPSLFEQVLGIDNTPLTNKEVEINEYSLELEKDTKKPVTASKQSRKLFKTSELVKVAS